MHQPKEASVHPYNLEQATKRFQREYIQNALEATDWDLEKTANLLEIEGYKLQHKIESYNISLKKM